MTEGRVPRAEAEGAPGPTADQYDEDIAEAVPGQGGPGGVTQSEFDAGSNVPLTPEEEALLPEKTPVSDNALLEDVSNLEINLRTDPAEFETVPTLEKLEEWQDKSLDLLSRLSTPNNNLAKNRNSAELANTALQGLEHALSPGRWIMRHGETRRLSDGTEFKVQDIESMFERIALVAKTKGDEDLQAQLAKDQVAKAARERGGTPQTPAETKQAEEDELKIIQGQYKQIKTGPGVRPEGAPEHIIGFDDQLDQMRYRALLLHLKTCLDMGAKATEASGSGLHIPLDAAIKGIEDRVALSRELRSKSPEYLKLFERRLKIAKRGRNEDDAGGDSRSQPTEAEAHQLAAQQRQDDEEKEAEEKKKAGTSDDDGAGGGKAGEVDTRPNEFTFSNYVGLVHAVKRNNDNALTPLQREDMARHAGDTIQATKLTAADFWQQRKNAASPDIRKAAHDQYTATVKDMQELLKAERGLAESLGKLASRPSAWHDEYDQLKDEIKGKTGNKADGST